LVADNSIYLVLLDKENSFFYKFPYDENLRNGIGNFYKSATKLNLKDTSIFDNSKLLYKTILEKALKETNATDLTIIPDDMLYYIPFDALVTNDEANSFLIKTHSVSYANSATILQEQREKIPKNENKLLVFAPDFELQSIETIQGKIEASSLVYSKQEAENITIFSNDSIDANVLYAKDIYNYTTNADIVTLSACETGIGKLQKGEGMLSLSRAFNYAGASSIVNTLWKINDQSSSEIISNFYKNLDKGFSKKEALRQAKLAYLNPYFWSGIIITGNTMPVVSTTNFWWFILGGILLIAIIMFRKRLLKFF